MNDIYNFINKKLIVNSRQTLEEIKKESYETYLLIQKHISGKTLTKEEKRRLLSNLKDILTKLGYGAIFMLPGGTVLLLILNIIFLVSWVSHIFFKVALVIIDKGLKELLPINFNQISLLIFLLIGAFIPADMKSLDNTSTLVVFKLSGSPRINLLPSTCSITPGLFINAAG